jgi:hypothetical protein
LEGTFDAVYAAGDRFADGARVLPGMTLTLGGDLCLIKDWCKVPRPPAPEIRQLACDLYDEAKGACENQPDHARLCAAVAAAMDASTNVTSEKYDDTDAFLTGIIDQVADVPRLQQQLMVLRSGHRDRLETWYHAGDAERKARQRGAWLSTHCSYAPTALELREAFGCGPGSQSCPTVAGCEKPQPR